MTSRLCARDVALAVIRDVFGRERRGAQEAFDYRVRRAALSPRDRALTAELAYGSIKMRRALDWYVQPYLAGRWAPLPPAIQEAIRLGAYQLRFMRGIEQHAAVYETVGAARRVGHRGTAGIVNAVLRRLIADDPAPPAPLDFSTAEEYLGTLYSVPTWIAAQWRERFGERARDALAGVDGPPALGLRVNTMRAGVAEVADALARRGIVARRSEMVADALVVDERPDLPLGEDAGARWSVQSETSCVPVDLLDPRPGESVADLCSGRGNKSLQIAARTNDAGSLTCVELEERKARVLERRLGAAGINSARVVVGDARGPLPFEHDAVLVDAPCSGLGIIGRQPEARWRKSAKDGERLSVAQAALLRAAAAATRRGGRIAYSVCTTDPRECEGVVSAFLAETPGFERSPLPARYAQFVSGSGDVSIPPGIAARDGFYVALLVRTGS